MEGKIKKILVSFSVLAVSAMMFSGVSALAAPDDSVDVGEQFTDSSLMGSGVEYSEGEYANTIDDINKMITEEDYDGVTVYVNDIANKDLKIRVLDYLGMYYPQFYAFAVSNGEVGIDVEYLGSFKDKDENGNDIEGGNTSVALYNTVTAYKLGLISDITWQLSGKENEYTASMPGEVLDSDRVDKTINGDGSVSFGLIINGAYFEEDDTPQIEATVSLNN